MSIGSPDRRDPSRAAGERAEAVEVTVGRIARAHGLRGDVFVDIRTDEPERRFAAGTGFETRSSGRLVVESVRWHGSRLLVRFERVDDRELAERLRGVELRLEVPYDEVPDDPEEFYDHQLRGLAAYTAGRGGESPVFVGRVTDVLHLPTQDTLVVDVDGTETLVPFVRDLVPLVDVAHGRLEIADRPGLLPS